MEQAQSMNETQESCVPEGLPCGKRSNHVSLPGEVSSREVVKDIMGRDEINKDANHESK